MKVLVVASEAGRPHNPAPAAGARSPRRFVDLDRAPVEEALRLRENGSADEVVIVGVGGLKARILLRLALGMGADRAVLVHGEDEPAAEKISRLVAELAAHEQPDVILLGASAGAALARMSWDCAGKPATPKLSKLAQDACRYPTLIKTRKATSKRWDIMTVTELLPAEKPRSIADAFGVEKLMLLADAISPSADRIREPH